MLPQLRTLGEELRRARESRGIGVDELAGRLHIGSNQLIALESGDPSGLPEGVFVIALAKRIATVLGVDLQTRITQVREILQQQQAPRRALPPPLPARDLQRPAGRSLPAAAGPALLAALAILAAVAAVLGLLRTLRPQQAAPPPAAARTGIPKATPAVAGTPATPATPAAAAGQLVLSAAVPSWLHVRDGKGVTLFEGSFEGEKRFPLKGGLEVRAGRPHAVTAAVGGAAPKPLGGVNDLDWRRFSEASAPPAP